MFRLPVAAIAVAAVLSGCESSGVDIPPGSESLKSCDFNRTIKIDDLKDIGAPGCDMVGTTIQFPDGRTAEVAPIGEAFSEGDTRQETRISLGNWGVPGVAAATYEEGGPVHAIWATSKEALDLELSLLKKSGLDVGDVRP